MAGRGVLLQIFCVNALSGLISFLLLPFRLDWNRIDCVNALSGLISFLLTKFFQKFEELQKSVNALSGLISFLLVTRTARRYRRLYCVNALSGLISFLQYPLKTLINTGFPGSFLQVFVRIF